MVYVLCTDKRHSYRYRCLTDGVNQHSGHLYIFYISLAAEFPNDHLYCHSVLWKCRNMAT